MKKHKVGSFQLGDKYVDLYLTEESGASFTCRPGKGKVLEICLGVGNNWFDMLRRLLHETFEFAFDDLCVRYLPVR